MYLSKVLYIYYSTHLSFCFNFFLHGESSVCASIEVKQHPPVWRLTNNHLSTAQENPGNLQGTVIYTMYECSPLTKKLRIILYFKECHLKNQVSFLGVSYSYGNHERSLSIQLLFCNLIHIKENVFV